MEKHRCSVVTRHGPKISMHHMAKGIHDTKDMSRNFREAWKMRPFTRLLARTLYSPALLSPSHRRHAVLVSRSLQLQPDIRRPESARLGVLASPWSASQLRRFRIRGADVRPGNVIQRKGKTYQVVKSQHTTQGRGGAAIQQQSRSCQKIKALRKQTEQKEHYGIRNVVNKKKGKEVYVEHKSMTYLYVDDDTDCVVLMDNKKVSLENGLTVQNLVPIQDGDTEIGILEKSMAIGQCMEMGQDGFWGQNLLKPKQR
ncbi:hypothetical protein RJ639_044218 [Escallonia herrerae]|uniref:Translation elongation factor KOW-like domain-containing protein n=1 Tax=Escallonia herrerae TaxID=1293975 RepID=A0AA88WD74_9ASTE|nr:hypothetical protein RJ639_044218 [Escallonia herrerae]